MRYALLVFVLMCSSATAAPVLVTKDNYKSAADSPFDLAGGGFYLEDFEDAAVNTPGLGVTSQPKGFTDYRVIDASQGAVSVDAGGKTIGPTILLNDLNLHNFMFLVLNFDPVALGGSP